MAKYTREELEQALDIYNPARDGNRVVGGWLKAGGKFICPPQVNMAYLAKSKS